MKKLGFLAILLAVFAVPALVLVGCGGGLAAPTIAVNATTGVVTWTSPAAADIAEGYERGYTMRVTVGGNTYYFWSEVQSGFNITTSGQNWVRLADIDSLTPTMRSLPETGIASIRVMAWEDNMETDSFRESGWSNTVTFDLAGEAGECEDPDCDDDDLCDDCAD